MDFITLSIKIANEQTQDLCAIELIEVKSRRIVLQKSWLIKPLMLTISPLCAKKYHLKLIELMDAPTLSDVWPEISSLIQGKIVFCHKAIWTISILLKALDKRQLTYPNCQIGCTLMISKSLYPHLDSHQLGQLASILNLRQTTSLEPKPSEAVQTAQLLLHVAYNQNYFKLDDFLQGFHLILGTIHPNQSPSFVAPSFDRLGAMDISRDSSCKLASSVLSLSQSHTAQAPYNFQGKVVVLTGPLESMPRVDAVKKLHALGATHSGSVTSKTQVVLTNVKNPEQLPLDTLTSKLRRALLLKAQGQCIDIINEETFLYAISSFHL